MQIIELENIKIEVTRKAVKNFRVVVYLSEMYVRASAPLRATDKQINDFLKSKLDWVKMQLQKAAQKAASKPPPTPPNVMPTNFVFQGKTYKVLLQPSLTEIDVQLNANTDTIEVFAPEQTTPVQMTALLWEFCRVELYKQLPVLAEKWEKIVGVKANKWGVKKVKTRWGSCNVVKKHIWLNSELATKPLHCLEYVIAHELVHLLEPSHNDRFWGFMDKFYPYWRAVRAELNNKDC